MRHSKVERQQCQLEEFRQQFERRWSCGCAGFISEACERIEYYGKDGVNKDEKQRWVRFSLL